VTAARRPPFDVTAVVLHVLALVVWPAAVGYTTFRLLMDRFPNRRNS
jgi:hypothetical protein